MVKIFQNYYKPTQRAYIKFMPYKNEKSNKWLENQAILDIYLEDHKCDYIGVLSWKFFNKMKMTHNYLFTPEQIISEVEKGEYDVYTFMKDQNDFNRRRYQGSRVWKIAEKWHEYMIPIAKRLFELLGVNENPETLEVHCIYYNYWIARKEVFDEYVEKWLLPAMNFMETDPHLKDLCERDAKYEGQANQPLKGDACEAVFGKRYYTYHPFVLERLFATFIQVKGYTVKDIE